MSVEINPIESFPSEKFSTALIVCVRNKGGLFMRGEQNQRKVNSCPGKMLTSMVGFVVIVIMWTVYSLVVFDGIFSPIYVVDLYSDPYGYYQKYVGSSLLQYGQEYRLDDVDTKDWKVYRDIKNNFYFKYPNELTVGNFSQNEYQRSIQFLNGERKEDGVCEISTESKGWKLGKDGLPGVRNQTNRDVLNNEASELRYIYDQYGGVIGVSSTRFFQNDTGDVKFTGATFIERDTGLFLHVVDYGNTCREGVVKGILATFRFID